MLYEAAVGTAAGWEVAPRYAELLAAEPLITYMQATATEVDADGGTVTVVPAGGGAGAPVALPYDRLVVAVGGKPSLPDGIPGLDTHAYPLHSYEGAVALKGALTAAVAAGRRRRSPAAIVVVGGGYSGVEMATTVASRYGADVTVSLVTAGDGIMPAAAAASQAAGVAALTAQGVSLVPRTRVAAITAESVTLVNASAGTSGTVVTPADVVVWTAGAVPATAGVPGVSGGAPLVGGKVAVDECLRVPAAPGVYALGDAAAVTGGDAPTAAAAVQQAEVAGWNVWAGLTGRVPLAYAQVYLGEMLTLGERAASVGTPFGVSLDGPAAAAVRRAAYLARMPTAGHRGRVAVSWGTAALLSAVQGLTGWGEAAADGGRKDSMAPPAE